jgi:exonuclease III
MQSLNISTLCKRTSQKVLSVTSSGSDIVFLSDLRLNSTKQISAIEDVKKRFMFRGYDFIHNSKKNSRGVGILISNKLVYNIKKYSRDLNDNILIIDITIAGFSLTLGAVYGPNEDDEFFF